MKEGERTQAGGRALWERARAAVLGPLAARAPGLDALDLAAYLDGRLDEAGRARVEAALAASPEMLDWCLTARAALDDPEAAKAAPASLVARARALAPNDRRPEPPASWPARLARLVAAPAMPGRALAFASIAAAFVLVSVAGFELGRAEVDYSAEVDSLIAQEVASLVVRGDEDLL